MTKTGPHYAIIDAAPTDEDAKDFLAGALGLTGTEISRTIHRKGRGSTFVHAHRRNEEVYIITRGRGWLYLDGEEIPIEEGNVIRVSSPARRALRAADDEDLAYYCIQADTGSLVQATRADGIIVPEKASWMAPGV